MDELYLPLLDGLLEGDYLAHYLFDQQEGEALVVVVEVGLDEVFRAVPEEGVGVSLMQEQLAVGPYP